ncbi:MAG: sulfatase-like hydrolase/transferase [Anaerolineae bacterium]|nr:sulfatase-like hydrolase/transferase [Anaerolineae bacterium]
MAPGQPNVLVIMSDQHRHDYVGCAGAAFVHTPNLDRIAARGVRFTQCVTNCPVCAPARIGLATGLQPHRLGALDNHSYLPRSVPTHYQRFRDAGYRVGCVGKLDLAKPDPYNGRYGDRPCVYGWGFTHPEECEGKMHAGSSPTPIGPYTHYLAERGLLQRFYEDYRARQARGWVIGASHDSVLPADAFEDTYIGRRAAAWIRSVPDDYPWFYFCSFAGPHDPFDPPTAYAARYRGAPVPDPIADSMEGKPAGVRAARERRWGPVAGASAEEIAVTRRQYCAAISAIDDQVGQILDALEARGMIDNTFVIYTSDHGEMLGDHGFYAKSVSYESALRVPLLVAGPGIAGGRVSEALVELIDVNPTACALAGLPPQERIDARSFAGVLYGVSETHRSETISAIRQFRCIRTERYKYVENYNDLSELYDLQEDPHELQNLGAGEPAQARKLAARLHQRAAEGKWLR